LPELELLPEKRTKLEFKPPQKFRATLLILIIVFVVYGGLNFYNQSLENKINDIDSVLINNNATRDKNKEERISSARIKLIQAKNLLNEHPLWSKGFEKIQNLTLPAVRFKNINTSLTERKIEFSAIAPDFTTVARQGANFLSEPSIEDIQINQARSLTSGEIEFSMKLKINPKTFLK